MHKKKPRRQQTVLYSLNTRKKISENKLNIAWWRNSMLVVVSYNGTWLVVIKPCDYED